MNAKRVAVIGGGISGLSTAFYLQEFSREKNIPLEITLIEASNRLGGIIQTERRDGFVIEHGPDMFLNEQPVMGELCRMLGIEHELIETREELRKSFIYSGGKLHQVPDGFYLIAPSKLSALFNLSFMSLWGKLRMGAEYFISPRKENGDESVAHFMRRRFGREAHEKIGQPMFGGIYTADPDKLSLKATMPRFLNMERESGSVMRALFKRKSLGSEISEASGPRYGLFMSFRNGMQTLVDSLTSHMNNVRFLRSASVSKIKQINSWNIDIQNGSRIEADHLILAVSSQRAAELLEETSAELSKELFAIPHESVATVNVAYTKKDLGRDLDGFGFVVPSAEKRKLIGCTFSSVKFPGRAPENTVLLRAFLGGAFGRDRVSLNDAEISEIVRREFRDILGITAKPLFILVKRHLNAMPQYHIGHLDRVKRIEALAGNIPDFSFTSSALRGVGIPDCVVQAKDTAEKLIRNLNPAL